MTKRIVMALALVAGTAGAVSAQTVAVSATVGTVAQPNGVVQALQFPSALPGGGDVIVDEGDVGPVAAGVAQMGHAQFQINLPGVDVQVSSLTELTADGHTGDPLPIAIECAEGPTSGAGITLGVCGVHELTYSGNGLETRAVWIGGTILDADLVSATAGAYVGSIDVTIVP